MRATTIITTAVLLIITATAPAVAEVNDVARVTAGLQALYGFGAGGGTVVPDVSGQGAPLNLTISDPGAVTWLPGGGLVLNAPVVLNSGVPATKIIDACQASRSVTLEAWVQAANLTQFGPARILTLSQDGYPNGGNFMLSQSYAAVDARLRTTATDRYGMPGLSAAGVLDTELRHLVYTRTDTGVTTLYVDGAPVASGSTAGTFSNWGTGYTLTLGNEPPGNRTWLGTMYLAAVYSRALDAAEVAQNFAAGPQIVVTPVAPTIVAQPQPATVPLGATATFGVTATGTPPLSYQWQRDQVDIPGATGSSYTTPPTTLADDGALFRCVVSNGAGSATSEEALLTVLESIARVTAGLQALYGFGAGGGTVVPDVSGQGAPLNLTISDPGAVTWLPGGGLVLNAPVVLNSGVPATKIIDACQASRSVTLEAWVQAANLTQFGPARILTLSQDGYPNGGNFMLSQSYAAVDARLRTTATDRYGMPGLSAAGVLDTELRHLVYTRTDTGVTTLYVDGAPVASGSTAGTFSNWGTGYTLTLGNEPPGNRTWLGTMYLAAVYSRALDAAEVAQNFAAGPQLGSPPEYTLTVNIIGNGSVTLDPAGGTYVVGTPVELTAIADPDWFFSGWSGDLGGYDNPATIDMTGDLTVTATFLEGSGLAFFEDYEEGFTLGADVGEHPEWFDGTGTDGSDVTAGIGVAGSIGLAPGNTIFTWIAHPFDWNAPNFQRVSFQMDFQTDPSGNFDDDRLGWMTTDNDPSSANIFGVQLDHSDGGIVTYWRDTSGTRIQDPIVPLSALAANTWFRFRASIIKLTAAAARIEVSLVELDSSGNPTGTPYIGVVENTSTWPGGAPATGYFTASTMWAGYKNYEALAGAADNALLEVLTGPVTQHTLIVQTSGNGHVTANPDQALYDYGETVELTAFPDPGWRFSHWSGDFVGTANPALVTITGDMLITANFVEEGPVAGVCEDFEVGYTLGTELREHPD